MDLASMSLNDLRKLQMRVTTEIQRRADGERRALLKQFKKMAADKGVSFEELLNTPEPGVKAPVVRRGRKPGAKKAAPSAAPSVIRYRHPDNPAWAWSGRGRRPQWFLDWVAADKPLAQLEVNTGA